MISVLKNVFPFNLPFFYWGDNTKTDNQLDETNDGVIVMARGPIIQVATMEQIQNMQKPFKELLETIVTEAVEYAKQIHDYYDQEGHWFPCGAADVVLDWTNEMNRKMILLFKKEATEKKHDYWKGHQRPSSKPHRVFLQVMSVT